MQCSPPSSSCFFLFRPPLSRSQAFSSLCKRSDYNLSLFLSPTHPLTIVYPLCHPCIYNSLCYLAHPHPLFYIFSISHTLISIFSTSLTKFFRSFAPHTHPHFSILYLQQSTSFLPQRHNSLSFLPHTHTPSHVSSSTHTHTHAFAVTKLCAHPVAITHVLIGLAPIPESSVSVRFKA